VTDPDASQVTTADGAPGPADGAPGPADGAPGAPGGADDGGRWQRVHPLTPAVRSWQGLVVLIFFFAQDFGQRILPGGGFGGGGMPEVGGRVLAGGGVVVVIALLLAVGLVVLSWRMTRYRVTADALELHRGILFRSQRQARLDRLQAVDVVQPLVARIFGLARLTLEVAGGSDSRIELSYLTDTEAHRLRRHLLARAAGVSYETEDAPEAPEHPVLEVPGQRLALSLLLSGTTVVLVVLVALLVGSVVVTGRSVFLTALLPGLIGTASVLWRRFSGGFGFTVTSSPDGVRLRHGLLEHRAQTVPPGRVQAVQLSQPLLWRHEDWWQVKINVAGYGSGPDQAQQAESTLLPVGTRAEAVAVLALVLPDLGVGDAEHPAAVIDAGLTGVLADGGFTGSPRSARRLDPIGWRRNGFRVTEQALLLRAGRLQRRLEVVPHARTQSCGVAQGPLQARLGLASFVLHSTPGPIGPGVQHLPVGVAADLLQRQAERAHRARLVAGPERWMEHPTG